MPDFDVVVVGGGSSGCALVGRLCSMSELSVCLVEAGPDYGPLEGGRWPPELLDRRSVPRTHDWGYVQELSGSRTLPESRAKVIGGCSSHNQCAAIWGTPDDYDKWAEAGNPGWSYKQITPIIDQIEKASPESSTPYRGRNGILPTRPYRDDELASWQRSFLESAVAAGFPRLLDLSAPLPEEGVTPFHANVVDLIRWNAAFAFLDRVRGRPNLTIMGDTLVDRLVLRQGKAISVVCHARGNILELTARTFILSAGAHGSPSILMRSGIGPVKHLEEMGIPVELNLPGVGQNLHDHSGVTVLFEPSEAGRREFGEDLASGRFHESGVILRAKSIYSAGGFDLHIVPYQARTDSGEWNFGISANNMQPLSRGRLLLLDRDPLSPPKIDFQFLTDTGNQDIAVATEGLRLVRRLAKFSPLSTLVSSESEPGQHIIEDRELHSYIRANIHDYAHPVGTCKMGPPSDPTSVVDHTGRLRGTSNVFVADASIIPQIPRANTNLTCMLIGLRIADLLLELVI